MDDLEKLAWRLWKAEAERAAPNVAKGRTPEAFAEQSHDTRARFLHLANAANELVPASELAPIGQELIDDRRLQLDGSNMFSRCRQNGIPKMESGVTGKVSLKTSYEIQAERLAKLSENATVAMGAANLAAENDAGPDIMQTLMSENAAAHDALAYALVNAYRSGELVPASELAELRAENARLREENARLIQPTWFYAEGWEEHNFFSPNEVVDYVDPTADCVVEIATARPLPSIWVAIRCAIGDDADELWTFTEHATEGEARAALGEQP